MRHESSCALRCSASPMRTRKCVRRDAQAFSARAASSPSPAATVAGGESRLGAGVVRGWAQSRCTCGRGEPSLSADVSRSGPSLGADVGRGACCTTRVRSAAVAMRCRNGRRLFSVRMPGGMPGGAALRFEETQRRSSPLLLQPLSQLRSRPMRLSAQRGSRPAT